MSFSHNYVSLAGNLTRDPELRTTNSSNAVANFSIAVNHRYRDRDGNTKDEPAFIDCETWGRQAETVAQYLQKGSPAFIEGRLKFDSWEDKDGKRQSRLRVVANRVQFLGSGRPDGDGDSPASNADSDAPRPRARDRSNDLGAAFDEGDPPF
ncbi:MAG: single-stranded DNA-binding protein [Planctomycetota bacterium]|jgi:single-strand DNA-binding protein|nr:single-stranded DNA-binding protein [Planctomycetota bacterium]